MHLAALLEFKCDICGECYKSESAINRHKKKVH